MKTAMRPSSVPLVTVDPYFSVWSPADRLTDDFTRHWTGQRQAMTGLIRIDGAVWRFAGRVEPNAARYYTEPTAMHQSDLTVTPLSTVYSFEAAGVNLTVRFTTPLLLDDPDLLSRPASYVAFEVRSTDGKRHEVTVYFDVTGEWCVDQPKQTVVWEHGGSKDIGWLRMNHEQQAYLNKSGDDHRIDWGHFYLCARNRNYTSFYTGSAEIRKSFVRNADLASAEPFAMPQAVSDSNPVMAVTFDFGNIGAEPVTAAAAAK